MISHKDVLHANIAYHDKIAGNYAKKPLVVGKYTVKRLDSLIKRLARLSDGESFLDLGTGTGNLMDFAERHFKKAYGIDVSLNLLKLQKPGRNLLIGDANNQPFADNTFSCLGIFSVLHHFHELQPLIKECHRILKSGGIFYSDYDPNYYFKRLINPIINVSSNKAKNTENEFDLAEYYGRTGLKPDHIARLLKNQGFREVKVVYHMYAKSFSKIDLLVYAADKLTDSLGINFLMKNFSPQFMIIAKK